MILETTELDVIIKEKIDRLSNISNLLSSTTPNNESNSNSDNLESLNITNSNINSYSIYSIDQASEYNYNKSTYVKSKDSNKNKKGKQAPSTLKDKENIKSNELSKVVSDKSNTYSIIFSVSNFITALISSKNKEVEGYKNSVMNTYEVNFLSQLKKNVLNLEKNFNILYSSIQDLSDLLKLCNQQREEFRERLFERKSTDSLIDNNKKDTNNSSRDKNEHISIFSKGGNKLKEEFKIKAIEYHINSITKINSKPNKREKVITKLQREIKDKDYIINQLKSNNKDREINTAFNQPSSIILNDLRITPSISKRETL